MRVPVEELDKYDGVVCFICGEYLLNHSPSDLAYMNLASGRKKKAKPERYYLFECPNCGRIAHKRCWYEEAEEKVKLGWFKRGWQLVCPGCGEEISDVREDKTDWDKGYQIPGHPDDELPAIFTSDSFMWKAGSMFGKMGKAIGDLFKAVGLGSLSDSETSAVARAAARVGKTIRDVASKVFKLDIPPAKRSEIKSLRCQNCGAALPMPESDEEAVVCEHCGTAHLLPK